MVMIADSYVPLPGVTGLAIAHGLKKVRPTFFAILNSNCTLHTSPCTRGWHFDPPAYLFKALRKRTEGTVAQYKRYVQGESIDLSGHYPASRDYCALHGYAWHRL